MGLRGQAADQTVQALPLELGQVKYEVYEQTGTGYNYDNLIEEIVRKYDVRIKLNPPTQNMSVNQTTRSKKDQAPTNNLLRRIDIKFCSQCLEKRHKSPQTHTDDECGHLHPELKDKHLTNRQLNKFERQHSINTPETKLSSQRQLSPANHKTLMCGRFPPDTAFFDQGSDVTCTCRLDLLTNIKHLNTPERFSTISGESSSSLVGTMQLNLGHKNGTINWIETEAYYSPHYTSILSKRLLEKYKLYLFYKPPHSATFHNSSNEELVHDVPLANGDLIFKLNVNPIYNIPK